MTRTQIIRSTCVLAAALIASAAPTALSGQDSPAMAGDKAMTLGGGRGPTNTDAEGLAIKGYDPVSYQVGTQPVMGLERFTAVHEGATYRFASDENRAMFIADPARYAPAYGGYCAMGVVGGRKFDIDPMAFTIVEGRLYLNKDPRTRTMWMRDIGGYNVRADANWPRVMRLNGF